MMGRAPKTQITKLNGIQLQSSGYGMPLSLFYGTNRTTGNLIWYGDFRAIPHTQKAAGGKGLFSPSSKTTDYTYTAAVIMALGEGPIGGIGAVWKGKDLSSLSALGLTLIAGNSGQSPWSFLSSYNTSGNWSRDVAYGYEAQNPAFTDQVLGYDTTALLAAQAYDLGSDATIPNHGFEVISTAAHISAAGSGRDCNPRVFVEDFLTSTQYGVGFPTSWIGDYTTFSNYCLAAGILLSPFIQSPRPASQHLGDILLACNTDPLWSEGVLKLLPRGDTTLTGNSVTFTPDLTPVYDLNDSDFLPGSEGPVRIVRRTPADAFNEIRIEFSNRANQYNSEILAQNDQNAVELYGLRQAPITQMHFICEAAVGKVVAQILVQRSVHNLNDFEFDLDERYVLLEPGDYVTLTDVSIQLSRVLVRLREITETDGGYACVAEEMLVGVAAAALYPHDSGLRWLQDFNASPLQPAAPYVFELPADPSSTGLSLGIAVGGQMADLLYGGCHVWVSADGTNYQQAGTINGSSRYGTLTATLNSSGSPMSVVMTSPGQLATVSSGEAAQGATMISVNEEYLDYVTATLTSANHYNLTSLNRGFYDTVPASHISGHNWARVDDAICRLENLDLTLIGQTLHFKFTAFNTYRGGELDLSSATDYTYAVTGYMQILGQKAQLALIGQDSWLTPDEKLTVILDYAILTNEKPVLDAEAGAVGADATDYDVKYTALTTYLGTLSPAWNNTSVATPITRIDWDAAWNDFEDARRALVLVVKSIGQVTIYTRQYAPPATPTGDNPTGWSMSLQPGQESAWQSTGNRASSGSILGVWSTPQLTAQGAARDYDGGETYYLGNLVRFMGSTYQAIQDNFSGHAPTGTGQSNSYWGIFSAQGDPGTPASPPSPFIDTIDLTTTAGTINLRSIADANGYTGSGDATVTFRVPNTVTIRGLPGSPGGTGGIGIDSGTWPTGTYSIDVDLVVQSGGIVDAGGGVGGDGAGTGGAAGSGGLGGDAIYCRISMSVTIDAGGTVRGGGDGGSGGNSAVTGPPSEPITHGGGGGGGGAPNGTGGSAGAGDAGTPGSGSDGTTSGGGAGGASGGSLSTAGDAGSGFGVSGYAVRKNGNVVSVTNNGTMTGTAA